MTLNKFAFIAVMMFWLFSTGTMPVNSAQHEQSKQGLIISEMETIIS